MFVSVPYNRVLISELDVSDPIKQHGQYYKIYITQHYPTCLVELPWLQNRFDLSPGKFSSFRLYLEPWSGPAKDLATFFSQLESTVRDRLLHRGLLADPRPCVESDEDSEAKYVTIKIPTERSMYQCFTAGSPTDLMSAKRGVFVKLVLDLSSAWFDMSGKVFGLSPRLFHMLIMTCPMKFLGPSERDLQPSTSAKVSVEKKFVPSLDDIIKKRNELMSR